MRDIQHRRDLWELITDSRFHRPINVVEVGVAEGRFSQEILEWDLVDRLYLVDRWTSNPNQQGDGSLPTTWHEVNLSQVLDRVARFGDRAVILRGDSVEMASKVADKELSLVYIDADHSYEGVMRDLRAWFPKVRDWGFIALHDFLNLNYGVRQAVEEFCKEKGLEIHQIPENKPEDAGAWFQI